MATNSKPKLFKRSINMLGGNIFTEYSVWWVCKSNTHEAYGTTPEEAYKFWEAMKELQKNGRVLAHDYYEAIGWQPYSALKHVPITYSNRSTFPA
jgi:hypothetical protein